MQQSLAQLTLRASMAGAMTFTLLGLAHAQPSPSACGSLAASFGPFDYRSDFYVAAPGDSESHAAKLHLVEKAHFTPAVEALVRGETGTRPGPDIEYTLRVFPNHHRALAAVMRSWERSRQPTPIGFSRPAECYFERALRFRPTDNIVRMLYATFLVKAGRKAEVAPLLEAVLRDAGASPLTHYNVGMIYADAEMYDEAIAEAHRAIQLGSDRPELRQRLVSAGRWRDPPTATAPRPAGTTSSADAPSAPRR